MSHYDYQQSRAIEQCQPSFYSLIMAAMRRADSTNEAKLIEAFPEVYEELCARYKAPGGSLPSDNGGNVITTND